MCSPHSLDFKTWDLHASLALVLVQENCEGSRQVQVRSRKPSQKVFEKQMMAQNKAVNKKQHTAKQQAAKASRAARKDKVAAKVAQAFEVSYIHC